MFIPVAYHPDSSGLCLCLWHTIQTHLGYVYTCGIPSRLISAMFIPVAYHPDSFGLLHLYVATYLCFLASSKPTWGILCHSVKQRTLPQNTSLIERFEYKIYSDRLCWHDDVAYTMYNVV
jgi:hypothetical protein